MSANIKKMYFHRNGTNTNTDLNEWTETDYEIKCIFNFYV